MSDESESSSGEELVEIVLEGPGVGASLALEEDFIHWSRKLVTFVKYFTASAMVFMLFCALCSFGWALYVGICRIGRYPGDHFNCTTMGPDPQ